LRRQFKEIKGIMEGQAKPDTAVAVTCSRAADQEMMIRLLLRAGAGRWSVFGPQALGGVADGTIVTGLFVAISMTTGGGAWTTPRSTSRTGTTWQGSEAHKAAVHGRHGGDPYKDTGRPGSESR